MMDLAKEHGVTIIPIDSEHAALKQCLIGIQEDETKLHRATLTASGGPFWERDINDFDSITAAEALKQKRAAGRLARTQLSISPAKPSEQASSDKPGEHTAVLPVSASGADLSASGT